MRKDRFNKWMLVCMVLCFALMWPVTSMSEEDAQTYYDKGTDLLRQGKLSEAMASLTSAIDQLSAITVKTPEEKELLAEAYNNRGLAYYEQENYADAKNDFEQANVFNSQDTKVMSNLGLVYYAQKDYTNSAIWFNSAIAPVVDDPSKEEPHHADVYNNLGVSYANQDTPDLAKAQDAYSNAIRIALKQWTDLAIKTIGYTDAFYNRGNLFYNLQKYDQAITDYTVTIDYFKNSETPEATILDHAYYNRGLSYYDKGEYATAINDFVKATDVNPGYNWAYYAKGFAHYMLSQDTQAISEYQKILNSELDKYARFGLGLAYCRQGPFNQGMDYLYESCNAGCTEACETLEHNLQADPGLMLQFQMPQ